MKKSYFLGGLLIALILATFTFADTVTKGLIGKEDFSLHVTDNGGAETFTRATSTGSTLTLTKIAGDHFIWDGTYTRTIRPLHITGNGSTSALTSFLTGTFSGTVSAATLTASGAATVGTTLGVTGATTLAALSSTDITTGAGTFSSDITANGNIVGDAATTISGLAQVSLDTISIDTATVVPSAGTWVAGDIVINSAPTSRGTIAATGALFWRCITGGTPGTWQAVFPVFTVAPDNAAMTATQGMVAIDNSYIHVAINDNEWERVGIASW